MSWIDQGPISVPPKSTVTFAAAALAAVALFGVGYGVHAVWRSGGPATGGSGDQSQDAQAVSARPLVDLTAVEQKPPPATNAAPAANAVADNDNSDAEANSIAERTAAAQAVQSKPAQQSGDIDQILTSPSEKPQAPAKPSTDESAPGSPNKSDVPF